MANRSTKEAIGVNALANFAKAFVDARSQRQQRAIDEDKFTRELASKRLEDEQALRYQRFQAELAAQKELRNVTQAGAMESIYDADRNLTGYKQRGVDPSSVAAGQSEIEGILNRYRGVSNAPIGLPGLLTSENVVEDPYGTNTPSVLPGVSQGTPNAAGAPLEVNPVALPDYQTNRQTGLRPAESVKTTAAKDGSAVNKQAIKDVNNAVADYEKIQTETDYSVETLNKIIDKIPGTRGGLAGAGMQAASSSFGIGSNTGTFVQTAEVLNALKGMAVQLLKPTFGGNISDGEREEVMKISGALTTMQPAERVVAANRMIEISELAARRAKDKAESLATNYGIEPKFKNRSVKKTPKAPIVAPEETAEQRKARLIEELKGAK